MKTISLIGLGFVLSLSASAQVRNHTFEIDEGSIMLNDERAEFNGYATAPSALNKVMTAQVFDDTGALVATGNSTIFSRVNTAFHFFVSYPPGSIQPGRLAGISVTDTPGTQAGVDGAFVWTFFETGVPTLGQFGMLLMIVLLTLLGLRYLRKTAPTS